MYREYQVLCDIKRFHEGQTDKSGDPYWWHPVRVRKNLPDNAPWNAIAAAYLHDVLEDTSVTAGDLLGYGYSEDLLCDVQMLNKHNYRHMTYLEWVQHTADSNRIVPKLVKLCDNIDNMNPFRGFRIPDSMEKKYDNSMAILLPSVEDEFPIMKERVRQVLDLRNLVYR